jgi:peptidoglycan hydrolase-like protein with peptidoglycan-binding domain
MVNYFGATEYQTGSSGKEVSQIQGMLAFLGYLQTAPDGIYGPKTKEAVQRFQSDKGLAIDGIVGPITWGALFGGAATPPAPPALIPAPKPTPAPTVIALPAGMSAQLFAGLTPVQMIVGGLGIMVLATMGLKAPRGKTRRRKRR